MSVFAAALVNSCVPKNTKMRKTKNNSDTLSRSSLSRRQEFWDNVFVGLVGLLALTFCFVGRDKDFFGVWLSAGLIQRICFMEILLKILA